MDRTMDETRSGGMERRRVGGRTSRRGDFATAVNVGQTERNASTAGGGALLLYGLLRGRWALAGLGAVLAYRGITGHCNVYRALGIDRASHDGEEIEGNLGTKIDHAVMVAAPPDQVYRVWRRLSNLPRFMSHLERVEELSGGRSRWTARVPAGMAITWDAELINDVPNETIAWRTVDTRIIDHAGSVRFEPTSDGRNTLVRVSMQYAPPGGELGHALAKALGQDPKQQIERDLEGFKRAMEAGELAA